MSDHLSKIETELLPEIEAAALKGNMNRVVAAVRQSILELVEHAKDNTGIAGPAGAAGVNGTNGVERHEVLSLVTSAIPLFQNMINETGDLRVKGNLVVDGEITSGGDVLAYAPDGAISLKTTPTKAAKKAPAKKTATKPTK